LALIIISNVIDAGPTLFGRTFSTVTGSVQSFFTGIGNWFGGIGDYFKGINELTEENRRLRALNDLLTADNNRLRYVDELNEELERLLETKRRYSEYNMVSGFVRAKDPGNWYNQFIIDVGSNDGIAVNMPVLAHGALIGRVSQVWNDFARVIALIDDVSSVSARVVRSSHVGTVRGDIELMMEGLILMEFTSLEVDVAEDDEIVTSQLSSYYPPGLLIGTVVGVRRDSRGMTTAIIRPEADFKQIDYVLVITELYELDYDD
jgi:rod shape-determining protein MreC